MPKQIKELRRFTEGTVASPSALDAPDEAAIYSQNVEAIDEEGKLKGIRDHSGLLAEGESLSYKIIRSDVTVVLPTNLAAGTGGSMTGATFLGEGSVITINIDNVAYSATTVGTASQATNDAAWTALETTLNALPSVLLAKTIEQTVAETSATELIVGMEIQFVDTIKTIAISANIGGSEAAFHDIVDLSLYLPLNANNMVLFNQQGINDLVYYSVTDDDDNTASGQVGTTRRLKVMKDFYKKKDDGRDVLDDSNNDIAFSADVLARKAQGAGDVIAMDKSNSAVYLGLGPEAESQWFGKIQNKQFGVKEEEYILQNAECKSVDDGSSVFSLNTLEIPLIGNDSSYALDDSYVFGLSDSTRKLHVIVNSGPDATLGKQAAANIDLPFNPRSLSIARAGMEDFKTSPATSTKFQYAWNGSGTDDTINSHVHTGTAAGGDLVTTTYFWMTEWGNNGKFHLVAARVYLDTGIHKLATTLIRSFTPSYKTVVDAANAPYLYQSIADEILRPPRTDSTIGDILETYITGSPDTWCLYLMLTAKAAFSFDEEWVYCIKDTDLDGTTQVGIAQPVTPPAQKLKKYSKAPLEQSGSQGYNLYGNPDILDGGKFGSRDWVGANGAWGQRSNSWKWRSTDSLGQLSNGKHVSVDSTTGWNKAWSYEDGGFGDFEQERYPGILLPDHAASTSALASLGMTQEQVNTALLSETSAYWIGDGDTPPTNRDWVEYGKTLKEFDFGTMHGWVESSGYEVTPLRQGLIRLDKDSHEVGVLAHVKGAQHTSKQKLVYDDWYYYPNLFTWVHGHAVKQTVAPVIVDYDEVLMFNLKPEHMGVRTCFIPSNSAYRHHLVPYTDDSGEVEFSLEFNDIIWDDALRPNHTVGDNSGQSQYSLKTCSKSQMASTINSSYDGNVFDVNQYSFARGVDPTIQTGGRTDIVEIIDHPGDLKGISKHMTNDANDQVISMSIKGAAGNKTYIYTYAWSRISGGATAAATKELSLQPQSGTYYNPLVGDNVGSAAIAVKLTGTTQAITASATLGDYSNGKYIADGQATVGYSTSTGDYLYGTGAAERNNYWFNPESALDFGLNITFADTAGTETIDEVVTKIDGNFVLNTAYYYKMTLVYDGFQESPLPTFAFTAIPSAGDQDYNTAVVKIFLAAPEKRASHVVIYRKNDINDYYRMVKEVSLASGWGYDSNKSQYFFTIVDEGRLGGTYEAISGMPETLRETTINYELSTIANGSLVVANCGHPQIKNGQNFVFKSKPNNFSVFEWTTDFVILPNTPTAIRWWAGKLYAFDESNTYVIDLNNMVLENTFEGVGCFGQASIATIDQGMFFCDSSNLYHHQGKYTQPVGTDIIQNSLLTDISNTDGHAWQDIDHQRPPRVVYNPRTQAVMFMFEDKMADGSIFTGSWNYSLHRKRWDLVEVPIPQSVLFGVENDAYLSDGNQIYQLNSSDNRKAYNWWSKTFDCGSATTQKSFSKVKMALNANEFTDNVGTISILVDGVACTYTTKIKDATIIYKLRKNRKGKKLQIKITGAQTEIDAISIIYTAKNVS